MADKARILTYEETVRVFKSICPFADGKQKPASERWGLLSINSYGDEWVDAGHQLADITHISATEGITRVGEGDPASE